MQLMHNPVRMSGINRHEAIVNKEVFMADMARCEVFNAQAVFDSWIRGEFFNARKFKVAYADSQALHFIKCSLLATLVSEVKVNQGEADILLSQEHAMLIFNAVVNAHVNEEEDTPDCSTILGALNEINNDQLSMLIFTSSSGFSCAVKTFFKNNNNETWSHLKGVSEASQSPDSPARLESLQLGRWMERHNNLRHSFNGVYLQDGGSESPGRSYSF